MLIKHSIARANGCFAVSKNVPRKPNAWHRIEDVARHTAFGYALAPALNQSVDNCRVGVAQIQRDCNEVVSGTRRLRTQKKSKIGIQKNAGGERRIKCLWFPVECCAIIVVPGAE